MGYWRIVLHHSIIIMKDWVSLSCSYWRVLIIETLVFKKFRYASVNMIHADEMLILLMLWSRKGKRLCLSRILTLKACVMHMEEQGTCPRCMSIYFLSFVMFGTPSDSDVYSLDTRSCINSHNTIRWIISICFKRKSPETNCTYSVIGFINYLPAKNWW